MIVRILSRGKSFSGLANYLTHDAEAKKTSERVAWTHTLNCANDDVPSAVNEMVWTARDAELLKQEAGIRAGGRATENSVKHLNLNWSPEDNPTREHMIETTEGFLRHMNWQEHQAVIVAHDDKPYKHVHVMLNAIQPETGLKLDEGFEQRRAQAWALQYEREQGRVYCEQRLKNPAERENAPPRNVWVAFRENEQEFGRAEKSLSRQEEISPGNQKNQKNDEWKSLKEIQRLERTRFFEQGKSEFSELRKSIYREVREEFRERWSNFYTDRKNGGDADELAARKAEIIAEQKTLLDDRRNEACAALREARDGCYRQLLDGQRDTRLDLRARQEAGLDNTAFLDSLRDRSYGGNASRCGESVSGEFRRAADAATRDRGEPHSRSAESREHSASSAGVGGVGAVGLKWGLGFFEALLAAAEGPHARATPNTDRDPFQAAAEDTARRLQREKQQAEEEQRHRQRSPSGE